MSSFKIRKLAADFLTLSQQYWGKAGAGLFIMCLEDKTALLTKRSKNVEQPGTWGIPGGAIENSESSSYDAALRESIEELGSVPKFERQQDTVVFKDGSFTYTSYVVVVTLEEKERWTPSITLNWENDQARWFPLNALPSNLHFGAQFIKKTLSEKGFDPFEDPKDELDWLRQGIKAIQLQAGPESKSLDAAMDIANNKPQFSEIYYEDKDKKIAYLKSIESALREALKSFLRAKDSESAFKVRDLIKKTQLSYVRFLDNNNYSQNVEIKKSPEREQSEHQGILYHGTSIPDIISALKTHQFIKGSAYDRLSLTTELPVAMKFGDAIFAFDAAKLQRRGAKKMRYRSDKQLEQYNKQTGQYSNEDNFKNPQISEIYRYEREWFIPLPFTFSDQDLIKIILVPNANTNREIKSNMTERAKKILEQYTEVPIQLTNWPSYSQQSTEATKESQVETSDLRADIFGMISLIREFMRLGKAYLAEDEARLRKRYPDYGPEDIKYRIKNSDLYYIINRVWLNIHELAERRGDLSVFDAKSYKDKIQSIKEIYQNASWSSIEPKQAENLKTILGKIITVDEPIQKGFHKTFFSKDEQLQEAALRYASGSYTSYRPAILDWIRRNVPKYIEMVDGITGYSEKRRDIERAIQDMPFIAQFPDDFLRQFPGGVADNAWIGTLSQDRLMKIFSHNEDFQSYHFKYELKRATGDRLQAIKTLQKIWNDENPQEIIPDHDPTTNPED